MGNSLSGKRTAKIMKMSGETFRLRTPVKAGEIIKNYPGYVLMESEMAKRYGLMAKPLDLHQNLVPKRVYFLLQMPNKDQYDGDKFPRRVVSGINMSAKDRLECLMLSRRSISDLYVPSGAAFNAKRSKRELGVSGMKVKMRLPKAQVQKLMEESKDEADAAAKILRLCQGNSVYGEFPVETRMIGKECGTRKSGYEDLRDGPKSTKKRVSFLPVEEKQMAVAFH